MTIYMVLTKDGLIIDSIFTSNQDACKRLNELNLNELKKTSLLGKEYRVEPKYVYESFNEFKCKRHD